MHANNLITQIALSGTLLSLLYPIGTFLGIENPLFLIAFGLHLLVHIFLLTKSFTYIYKTLAADKLGMIIGIFGVAIPLIILLALSFLPITNRDVLIHHLAVPKWWIARGSIHTITWHQWSFYPMLIQLAFTGFLSLKLSALCTLYHASYLILLAGLFRNVSGRAGQLGILFSFTIPLFIRLAGAPYVDLPLVVFGFAFYLLAFSEHKKSTLKSRGLILGILAGLLSATKYNGLLFIGLGSILLIIPFRKKIFTLLPNYIFGWSLIALPWYMKNLLITKNPIYPLLPKLFPSEDLLIQVPRLSNLVKHQASLSEAPLNFLSIPPKMLFFGADDNPLAFDGILSPLLIFCVLPMFLKSRTKKVVLGSILVITYCYLAILLSGPRSRYLAPILGIVVYLASLGIEKTLSLVRPKLQEVLLAVIVGAQITLGLLYIRDIVKEREVVSYFNDSDSKVYVNQRVTESLLADAARDNIPKDARIYLLYTGNRYFLYDQPLINSGYYSDRMLLTWLFSSSTESELKTYFQSHEVKYLALHSPRYLRTFEFYHKIDFLTDEKLQLWNSFATDYLTPTFEIGPYQVWKIR